MARYTGPVCKLCRAEGAKLMLKGERCLMAPKCSYERRAAGPTQRTGGRRRKPSEYSLQLRAKQKVRRIYGVLEKQFRRYFDLAESRSGVTGEALLQILETRLDNVVYRLGFATSRAQARQLLSHGHFTMNGKLMYVPSALVGAGDVVEVSPRAKGLEYFKIVAETISPAGVPSWLSLDAHNMRASVQALPQRSDVELAVSEQLIVEFYSR